MKLYYSPTSPFARKVRMAAIFLELEKEIELQLTDVYSPNDYFNINPLVKIPTLITRDGLALTNSPFILEYLNSLSLKKKILPELSPLRWEVLNDQSIADGMMEASVLRRYEILRDPDKRDPKFDFRQKEKVKNALNFFESKLKTINESPLKVSKLKRFDFQDITEWTVSEITLVCALGYLELRYSDENWLKDFPYLLFWYNEVSSLDVVINTKAKI